MTSELRPVRRAAQLALLLAATAAAPQAARAYTTEQADKGLAAFQHCVKCHSFGERPDTKPLAGPEALPEVSGKTELNEFVPLDTVADVAVYIRDRMGRDGIPGTVTEAEALQLTALILR